MGFRSVRTRWEERHLWSMVLASSSKASSSYLSTKYCSSSATALTASLPAMRRRASRTIA